MPPEPDLSKQGLDRIPDPRRRRGRRYRFGPLLALWLVAVFSGVTSLARIGRIAAELDARVLADLGCRRRGRS